MRYTPTDESSFYIGKLIFESMLCRDPEVQKTAMIVDSKGETYVGFNSIVKEHSHSPTTNQWHDKDFALITAEHKAIHKMLRSKSIVAYEVMTMYLNNPPTHIGILNCSEVGIKKIVYVITNEKAIDYDDWELVKKFVKERKFDLKLFEGNLNWMRDRLQKFHYLF